LIRKAEPDLIQAGELLDAAVKDIWVAKKIEREDSDWAFSIAYNSMLRSARALMFAEGFRPSGEDGHKTTVAYADSKLGTKFRPMLDLFDDMRKKRHRIVYEKTGAISSFEAHHAIETAVKFHAIVKDRVEKIT
jgi:uncharacterized protein (UPF0332 family)